MDIESWNQYGSNLCDICFKHNGTYVDICSEYGRSWVVGYDHKNIGIGHSKSGTGFKTRKEAFEWAKNEIGFTETYEEVIED